MEREAPAGVPRPDEQGNYTSPPLAALRRVWRDYGEGVATDEDVMTVLHAVADFAQLQIDQLNAQAESGRAQPEDRGFALILDAFEAHLDALEVMARQLDPEEPEDGAFERGLAMAQKATNQLMEGHQAVMDHIHATGTVSCMFCSHENPREAERCAQCGRTMPVPVAAKSSFSAVNAEGVQGGQEPSGETTENFVRLAQAVAAWRAGALDAEGLMEAIEEIEGRLLAHRHDNRKHVDLLERYAPERRRAVEAAIEATEASLARSLAALEKMKLAFVKEDDSYLETGLFDMEAAARTMVSSYRAMQAAEKGVIEC